MAFNFGFSGVDIDDSCDFAENTNVRHPPAIVKAAVATMIDGAAVEVKAHGLDELLALMPDRISYATTYIESPSGRVAYLPRRELYDVRIQLMAEDSIGNDETLNDIDKSDIRTGVYEGGFKTWECAVDLASLLLDRGPRKDIDELVRCDQVAELGSGTALPTLVLFRHALQNAIPVTFTLTDYNDSVLRLVTLPNLLLTWAASSVQPLINTSNGGQGDLDITPAVLAEFQRSLRTAGITLNFLSGPWSPRLASLIPSSAPDMGTLILGAETIYSPASTTAFVDLLVTLLKRVSMSKAVIGAKRVYFGVGGSVNGMKEACREQGAVCYEVENHDVRGMQSAGVGRALLEVQMY